jgi:hypothetical protein
MAARATASPLPAGLFLVALALLMRTQPPWGGADRNLAMVAIAGAALAASMFIRPNFAFAVVWLGAAYAWAAWRRQQTVKVFALAIGLVLALWMPFHNWYYGRELYLISKSGATISTPLGAKDYWAAAGDVLHGRLNTHAAAVTSAQLKGWLGGPGFVGANVVWFGWVMHSVNLFALAVSCWMALRWVIGRQEKSALGVVAVTVICAHLPMLFIFDTNIRYAMLGWDLSLILLVVWAAGRFASMAAAVADVSGSVALSGTTSR